MSSKYLIRMNDPADWLRTYDEGTQQVNDFILPIGPYEKNEMSDTIYHKNASVDYHEHAKGFETFFIRKGRVECVIRGQHFIAEKGDILHIPPYVAHGFVFLEEGTVWRELFQEINMAQGIMNKNRIKGNYDGLYDDPHFRTLYRQAHHNFTREKPVAVEVPRESVRELRMPGFSFSTHHLNGATFRLIVGRWESNGVKEVWEAEVEKGFKVYWDYPNPNDELYYVCNGRVKCNVLGEEFEAGPDCLIHIPPYTTHRFEALEDSRVYDCGCAARLLDLMEDWKSLKTYQPDKLEDPEFVSEYLRQYNCWVTYCGKD